MFMTAFIGFIIIATAKADSAIQLLLNCDRMFFEEIKSINGLQAISNKLKKAVIESHDEISIPINYTSPEGIKINKFIITYTNFNDFKTLWIKEIQGKYYYWSFESPQSIMQISELLSKNNKFIQNGDVYIYNPMIRFGNNNKWQSNRSASSGTMPRKDVTEKVLIIEKKQMV